MFVEIGAMASEAITSGNQADATRGGNRPQGARCRIVTGRAGVMDFIVSRAGRDTGGCASGSRMATGAGGIGAHCRGMIDRTVIGKIAAMTGKAGSRGDGHAASRGNDATFQQACAQRMAGVATIMDFIVGRANQNANGRAGSRSMTANTTRIAANPAQMIDAAVIDKIGPMAVGAIPRTDRRTSPRGDDSQQGAGRCVVAGDTGIMHLIIRRT